MRLMQSRLSVRLRHAHARLLPAVKLCGRGAHVRRDAVAAVSARVLLVQAGLLLLLLLVLLLLALLLLLGVAATGCWTLQRQALEFGGWRRHIRVVRGVALASW